MDFIWSLLWLMLALLFFSMGVSIFTGIITGRHRHKSLAIEGGLVTARGYSAVEATDVVLKVIDERERTREQAKNMARERAAAKQQGGCARTADEVATEMSRLRTVEEVTHELAVLSGQDVLLVPPGSKPDEWTFPERG